MKFQFTENSPVSSYGLVLREFVIEIEGQKLEVRKNKKVADILEKEGRLEHSLLVDLFNNIKLTIKK